MQYLIPLETLPKQQIALNFTPLKLPNCNCNTLFIFGKHVPMTNAINDLPLETPHPNGNCNTLIIPLEILPPWL